MRFRASLSCSPLRWRWPPAVRASLVLGGVRQRTRESEGAVTKIEWQNPHVFFYIDVRDEETGKVTNWALEMGAPAVIQRMGWRRTTMKIGDIVIVTGTKAKNGKPLANARSVVMASTGQKLGAGSSEGVTP